MTLKIFTDSELEWHSISTIKIITDYILDNEKYSLNHIIKDLLYSFKDLIYSKGQLTEEKYREVLEEYYSMLEEIDLFYFYNIRENYSKKAESELLKMINELKEIAYAYS